MRDEELTDFFAGLAMMGICSSRDEAGTLVHHGYKWIASEAYKIADAMMYERKRRDDEERTSC